MLSRLKKGAEREKALTQVNRVCVYAFDPFGGSLVNSAQTLMQKAQLPFMAVEVSDAGVRDAIASQISDKRRVLWLGQGNSENMTIENTAHNVFEGKVMDKEKPKAVSNPLRLCIPNLSQGSHAGDFYCNKALWEMLQNGVHGVFVHVPAKIEPSHCAVLHEILRALAN